MNTPDNAPAGTAPAPALVLLVATRKGAWLYHGDARREHWRVSGPHLLGHIVSHLVLDPRDGRTLLAAGGLIGLQPATRQGSSPTALPRPVGGLPGSGLRSERRRRHWY